MKKILFFILVIVVIGIVAAIVFSTPTIEANLSDAQPSAEIPEVATSETKEPPQTTQITPVTTTEKTTTTSNYTKETNVSKPKTEQKPELPYKNKYFTNSDNVRMRAQPRLDADIIESLKIGSRVTILKSNVYGDAVKDYKKTGWTQIQVWRGAKMETGYIYGAFISKIRSNKLFDKAVTAETKEATRIREGASSTFETLATIPTNTKLLVIGRTRDMKYLDGYGYDYWFKVEHGKGAGWVFGDLLRWDEFSKTGVPVINPRLK